VDEERELVGGYRPARWAAKNHMTRHPGTKLALREVDGCVWVKRLA
jgi:hypothetical protein